MRDAVIVGAVRSPVGRRNGGLARLHPVDLSAEVLQGLVDRQCGSSQQAVHFAAAGVVAGHYDVVVAGGVESMTRVPMFSNVVPGPGEPLSPGLRARYGDSLVPQGISAAQPTEREVELIACPTLKSVEGISR